jgi:hypothetical protein
MADAADFVLVGARSWGCFRRAIGMSGGSVYKRRPEPVPARTFTPTAWGFGTGNQLVFVAHLPRSPPAIQTSTRPSRPVLLTRRHSGRATREPAPRCCREPAAILPTSIAILHRTRRQLSHSRPTPAARPTTPRSRHRLACRQFLLGMQAGCGAERPAGGRVRQRDRCTPGRACPAGSGRRSTRRAPIRSGSGSAADLPATDGPQDPAAPERTCDCVGTVDGRGRRLRALGSGLRRRPRPPGVGVTSGRCVCSRRAATRKRWIPSLPATPSSYSAR